MEMTKQNFINDYIDRCNKVIDEKDFDEAKILFLEIRSVFENEIKGLMNGLSSKTGSALSGWEKSNRHWLSDMPIVKAKLTNYLTSLGGEIRKSPTINIINNNNNTNTLQCSIDIDILFEETRRKINEMESLSYDDTAAALSKLNELLEVIKSKESRKSKWSKVSSIIKWVADKSLDLAIAVSPAIFQVLTNL